MRFKTNAALLIGNGISWSKARKQNRKRKKVEKEAQKKVKELARLQKAAQKRLNKLIEVVVDEVVEAGAEAGAGAVVADEATHKPQSHHLQSFHIVTLTSLNLKVTQKSTRVIVR